MLLSGRVPPEVIKVSMHGSQIFGNALPRPPIQKQYVTSHPSIVCYIKVSYFFFGNPKAPTRHLAETATTRKTLFMGNKVWV
jgi:hypothetical protein